MYTHTQQENNREFPTFFFPPTFIFAMQALDEYLKKYSPSTIVGGTIVGSALAIAGSLFFVWFFFSPPFFFFFLCCLRYLTVL
jgi:hypothetical protein